MINLYAHQVVKSQQKIHTKVKNTNTVLTYRLIEDLVPSFTISSSQSFFISGSIAIEDSTSGESTGSSTFNSKLSSKLGKGQKNYMENFNLPTQHFRTSEYKYHELEKKLTTLNLITGFSVLQLNIMLSIIFIEAISLFNQIHFHVSLCRAYLEETPPPPPSL